jgi:hypothetical protein
MCKFFIRSKFSRRKWSSNPVIFCGARDLMYVTATFMSPTSNPFSSHGFASCWTSFGRLCDINGIDCPLRRAVRVLRAGRAVLLWRAAGRGFAVAGVPAPPFNVKKRGLLHSSKWARYWFLVEYRRRENCPMKIDMRQLFFWQSFCKTCKVSHDPKRFWPSRYSTLSRGVLISNECDKLSWVCLV